MVNLRADGVGDKSTWFDYAWQQVFLCLIVVVPIFFALRDIRYAAKCMHVVHSVGFRIALVLGQHTLSLNWCMNSWVPLSLTLLLSAAFIIATYYKLNQLGGTRTGRKVERWQNPNPQTLVSNLRNDDLQTLGSQPVMPKNLPDHCLGRKLKKAIKNFEVKVDLQKGVLRFG